MVTTTGPWFAWTGFGVLVLGAGVLLWRVTYRTFRRWRRLGDVDTVDATTVDPGRTVAVRGTAESLGETVRAYFAQRDALVRRTRIARRRRSSTERGGYRWDWFHDGYDAVPFEVVDGTGAVRVDPPDEYEDYGDLAQFRLSIDPSGIEVDLESGNRLSEARVAYEEDHHLRHTIADTDTGVRVRERFLESGDEVYVVGKATVDEDGAVVISGRSDTGTFTVAPDGEGTIRAPKRNSLVTGVLLGLFAAVATVAGTGLVVIGLLVGPV